MAKGDVTLDTLAEMVARGFQNTATDIAELEERVNGRIDSLTGEVNSLAENMTGNFGMLHRDIESLQKDYVSRLEYDDLAARVKLLERRLGVESGK